MLPHITKDAMLPGQMKVEGNTNVNNQNLIEQEEDNHINRKNDIIVNNMKNEHFNDCSNNDDLSLKYDNDSSEVVAFQLDDGFDYDNVKFTPKY